jgi:peptidyl-prolyl cis-trans isomerase C
MKRIVSWLRDPVVSFVTAGACIFLLSTFFSSSNNVSVIEVTEADIERLTYNWKMQKNDDPSPAELRDIVESYVKDEMYFRESKQLGLHINDSIVRRRLVQKLTFLTEDVIRLQPADDTARREFFAQNQETYRIPARFSFSHRFFSTDLRSDAEADAVASLAETSPVGDNFMLQSEYQGLTVGQIAGFFGQEFADALARLETKPEWQGPIKSAYGWHAIKLDNIEPSYIPSYADVAQQVASDAASAASASAKNAYYEDLKESYEVVYPASIRFLY